MATIQEICNEIYPLTIVADRYGGTYSGGQYTAWNCFSDEVPKEIDETDLVCASFWNEYYFMRNYVYRQSGVGDTIIEAVLNLYINIEKYKK